jgi:hypothetical protein
MCLGINCMTLHIFFLNRSILLGGFLDLGKYVCKID